MEYKTYYSSDAQLSLHTLDKSVCSEIIAKIEKISANPYLGKPLKNKWKNYRSARAGKYRIIYQLLEDEIIISKISHRKNAYDLFKV